MALRRILIKGDKTLEKKAKPVTQFNERLWQLLDDMRETLADANGAGLAAPQVGVLRRVILVLTPDHQGYDEFVNPEITVQEGEQTGPEGCLSVPGLCGLVSRPMKVSGRAQDRYGNPVTFEGEALIARALCHECDHLEGTLYTEKVIEYIDPDKDEDGEGQ